MKIGIDARFAGVHERGIGRYVYELVEGLITRGLHERHMLVLFVTKKNAYLWNDIPSVKKVIVPFKWYGIAEQLFFPFILLKEAVDVMHFPHYNVPIWYPKSYIVTIHDLLLHRYPSSNASTRHPLRFYIKYALYRVVVRQALYRAKHIIAVSEFTKKEIEALYPSMTTPIRVVYEGVSAPLLKKSQHKRGDLPAKYILSVGAAYPHKNLSTTIAALVPFLRHHKLSYILVGRSDYFYQRLKQFVAQKQYDDVVKFYGEVSDEYLAVLYRNAAVLVFPSLYEGFGLPALEAMASSCPVIASKHGALPEILGNAGMLVDDRKHSYEEAILTLIHNEDVRHEYLKRGRRRAKQFSWDAMAKQVEILYNIFTK